MATATAGSTPVFNDTDASIRNNIVEAFRLSSKKSIHASELRNRLNPENDNRKDYNIRSVLDRMIKVHQLWIDKKGFVFYGEPPRGTISLQLFR